MPRGLDARLPEMTARAPTIHVVPVLEPSPEAAARLRRLRRVAWWMDRSVPLVGRFRIGLDPLLGLVPGFGDWLGAGISLWMIYEAMRLGLPFSLLMRMGLNVAIEAAFGSVPLFGDVFDAAWQANQRNYALIERHYDARMRPRSAAWIGAIFAVFALLVLALFAAFIFAVARALQWLFAAFGSAAGF